MPLDVSKDSCDSCMRGSLHSPGVSGVTGPALRETSCINRSLAALSDVLGALAEGRGHIPYRNSRLTHLLQDALGTAVPRLPLPLPLPPGLLLPPRGLAGSGGLCLPSSGLAAPVNSVVVSRVV